MVIKIVIGILFIANVAALAMALGNLLKEGGRGSSDTRTARMLMIRAGLGFLLVASLVVGVLTGDLNVVAPWHTQP